MVQPVRFPRKPYTITYKDRNGELQKIKRQPAKLLHEMLPTDQVELLRGKNIDWEEEEVYTIKHINPRHPNVIQIQNDDDQTTFVDYFDLELDEKVAFRGQKIEESEEYNRYLLWP